MVAVAGNTRLLKDEDLRALLSGAGLRVTPQRMALLRELARLRVPVSHAEVTERLVSSALDRVTIYRNLIALTDAGLLVRTQLGDNTWRFELPRNAGELHGQHPHFVCSDCGEVTCLDASAVALHGELASYQVSEVQLRGRCAACVRT